MAERNAQRLPRTASICTVWLTAIDLALEIIKNSRSNKSIVFTDSKSSLEARKNKNKNNPPIIQLCNRINNLYSTKAIIICRIPNLLWTPRKEQVEKATKISLHSINTNTNIPTTDLKPTINRNITNKRQLLCETHEKNKTKNKCFWELQDLQKSDKNGN